jgi:tetratricopeptide (TPR) repeat protein
MAFDKRKALQAALTYTQQGKWDRAIAEYQTILKADPHDLTVCNNLGDLYARAGKAAEAIEQYLKLGELYRADGLSVKAIAVYKKIIKLDANRSQALLACADMYEEQGLTGEAKIQLTVVAEQYGKAGDTPKVIEIYQRLAALDQTNHALLTKLGDLLLKQGKREEAAAQYELGAEAAEAAGLAAESKRLRAKLRELRPEPLQATLGQAEKLLHEGKHAEAVDALLKATGSDHTNAQAWRLLGEAYIGLGQASEAITALERAVGLGLPEDEVRHPMAKALVLEGHTDEGITLCQKVIEDALARNNPEEAITLCQEIVALAPNLTSIHASLVKLLQDLGRDDEARVATWALAAAYEACGQTEDAIQVYHQLIERDPSDADAKARLDVLEGLPAPSGMREDLSLQGLEEGPATEAEPPALEEPAIAAPAPAGSAQVELTPAELAPTSLAAVEVEPTEVSATEPPALELSLNDELTPGDLSALGIGEGVEPEAESAQAFELDESGELAGIRYPFQEPHGAAVEGPGQLEGPAIEFPGEGPGEDASGPEALEEEEEEATGEVAELLAEAEVYLKYGLSEKARERLLEVVGLKPENLTAHRRLKTLYLERPQAEEASGEVLAIARILRGRGQLDAAQRELKEGLRLAPGNAALQEMAADLSGTHLPTEVTASEETRAAARPPEAQQIPDTFKGPENVAAQGDLAQDLQVGPVLMEGTGVAEGAPSEALSEIGPPLELPDLGGEVASLQEEFPPEFRSLLEEAGEASAAVDETSAASVDQVMAEDLAEAEFYLSQDMMEEARAVHRRMLARDSLHPAVTQLGKQIEPSVPTPAPEPVVRQPEAMTSFAGLMDETEPAPLEGSPPDVPDVLPEMLPEIGPAAEPRVADASAAAAHAPAIPEAPGPAESTRQTPDMISPKFSVQQGGGEAGADGFVNVGAELEEELAAEDRAASAITGSPPVEDVLRELQKGVREHLDEKDFETHYNMGIAYREMELYEEAVQEFRLAARDPGRALACADLLGLCSLAKGDPEAAIREFRAGLQVQGHPPESYYDLRYNLGLAYERNGDLGGALESFEALKADDERFRDVSARVQELRQRVPRPQVASLPASPIRTGEPAKRPKEKRISFI